MGGSNINTRATHQYQCINLRRLTSLVPGRSPEVNVGDDDLGLEGDLVVVDTHADRLELLDEVGHVVAEAQEVLLQITIFVDLAGHLELVALILDGTLPFDREQVGVGDAVEEDNATIDFEVVGRLRDVPRTDFCIGCGYAASSQGQTCHHGGADDCLDLVAHFHAFHCRVHCKYAEMYSDYYIIADSI